MRSLSDDGYYGIDCVNVLPKAQVAKAILKERFRRLETTSICLSRLVKIIYFENSLISQ